MAKPKPVYQISSNHEGNNKSSSGQGISFIAPERPKFQPVSNAITLGAAKTEVKKSNPSEFKISSSTQNNNNSNIGIAFIAPEKKKQTFSVSSGISFGSQSKNGTITQNSQGLSYIAPDPKKKNTVQYSGSNSVSIHFEGTGVPPPTKKKKKKHYEMEWDSKYKKSDPKSYKIESKVINLYFEGKKVSLDYIIQQLSQPSQAPNMSVKAFFSKKGRRRGGRK